MRDGRQAIRGSTSPACPACPACFALPALPCLPCLPCLLCSVAAAEQCPQVNAKLDGCNVKLSEPMPTLAPPIGARPFMVLGVSRAGLVGWAGAEGGAPGGRKQCHAAPTSAAALGEQLAEATASTPDS